MRVLVVTDTYPPDVNGVAGSLRTWVRELAKRGHVIEVVTTIPADADGDGGHFRHVVNSVPLPGYPGLRLGMTTTFRMLDVVEESRAEVIYVATETVLGIATVRAAKKLGVPVVSGFHTNFQNYLEDYHLPGLEEVAAGFLRTFHNQTVRTLTPSADTARQLERWGIANVGVVGRGVDAERFSPARRDAALRSEWGADERTPVAMHVGRVAAEKNLGLLIRAFTVFRWAHPGAPCVVVGDGPRAAWLKTEVPDLHFAGVRTGDDLARHYASADVFLFPSLTETFGNVVLESMASGLATVAFDYAAAAQFIRDGRNGWLASKGDEDHFLEKTHEAARSWDDAGMRAAARSDVMASSWETIGGLFEHELLQARGIGSLTAASQPPFAGAQSQVSVSP